MSHGKVMIIHLIVGLWKRHRTNEWIFSRSKIFRRRVEVELDLSNYAT